MSSSVSKIVEGISGADVARQSVKSMLAPESRVQFVILYGSGDSGQEEIARMLVQGWLCTSPESKPCGECQSCRAFEVDRAVDHLRIVPFGTGRLIKVGCLSASLNRDPKDYEGIYVKEFLRTRPLASPNKVIWMSEAERINANVAVALLKTLEELTDHYRFVFTTGQLSKVPMTIRSRAVLVPCQLSAPSEWPGGLGADQMIRRFARTPKEASFVDQQREVFDRLDTLLELAVRAHHREALRLSEDMRKIMDDVAASSSTEKRKAQGMIVSYAANWFLSVRPELPQWVQACETACGWIAGNVAVRSATDVLFLRGTVGIH